MQHDAPLEKLLSGHSKAEVKALANADNLLGKLLSSTSKAEAKAKAETKGDATKKAEEELNQEAAAGKAAGSWLKTQLVDH